MISFYENQYCSSRFPSCLWQLLTSTVLHGSQAVYENYYCSPWFPSCLWRLALFFRFPSCSWEPVLFSMVPKLSMKTSTVLHGSQAVYENQYCRVPQLSMKTSTTVSAGYLSCPLKSVLLSRIYKLFVSTWISIVLQDS